MFFFLKPLIPNTEEVDGVTYTYASFNDRVFASIIDTILSLILLAPVFMWLGGLVYDGADMMTIVRALGPGATPEEIQFALKESGAVEGWLTNNIIQTIIMAAIVLTFWHYRAATPGKMLLRMRIVNSKTFGPLTTRQSLIRFLGYFVSIIPFMLGFAWVAFNYKKQGWHDMIAGTVVIRVPKQKKEEESSSTPPSADRSDSQAPTSLE